MTQQTPEQILATICGDMDLLDDWEDRYRYIIDLGKDLPPFADEFRTDAHKVEGCVSQVWLVSTYQAPNMHYLADS
ncbi:MAG: SufE family protein, partial [Pseudomonadota bacterium]